jgi:cell division transport system permease protein
MGLRNWAYYSKHAFTSIFGNRLVHAISVGTITSSLILFGSFILLFYNLNNWMVEWGQSLSMSVYVQDEIDEKTKARIESLLKNLPSAELKEYVSKDKAMEDLVDGLGAHSGLLEGLKENPLPASFEIVFKDVNIRQLDPQKMKEEIEKIEGVQEVQYSEEWLDRLEGLIYVLKVAGFIISGFLCLAVLFITTNTIKLTIYSRRDEVEILKLVGATDRFVKMPFLIEGAIQGLVGGVIALSALFLLFMLFSLDKVHIIGLPVLEVVFLPMTYLASILLLGLILGLVGSLIAVGRFIDV